MKRTLLSAALICIFLFIAGCSAFSKNSEAGFDARDFDFKLTYGGNLKNVLDTAKNTLTVNAADGTKQVIKLKFTEEEMREIGDALVDIDIFSFPGEIKEKSNIFVDPTYSYNLQITYGSQHKNVFWIEKASESDNAVKLRALMKEIIGIAEAKNEAARLPGQ